MKLTPVVGRLVALPVNLRLGWKGQPGTNALKTFCAHFSVTKKKVLWTWLLVSTSVFSDAVSIWHQ